MLTDNFKVGNRVRVKSLTWYNKYADSDTGDIILKEVNFIADMSEFCGQVLTIVEINENGFYFCEGNGFMWTDLMLEDEAVTEFDDESETEGVELTSIEEVQIPDSKIYIYGIDVPADLIIRTLEEHGGINSTKIQGDIATCHYYIDPVDKTILRTDSPKIIHFLETYYTKITPVCEEPEIEQYVIKWITSAGGEKINGLYPEIYNSYDEAYSAAVSLVRPNTRQKFKIKKLI